MDWLRIQIWLHGDLYVLLFLATTIPLAAIIAFIVMIWDFCTRGKKQKVDIL